MEKYLNPRHIICQGLIFAFLLNSFGPLPVAQAQDFVLPAPGVPVGLSPAFNPPILKGIKVHSDNPFRFDFILDTGDDVSLRGAQATKQSFIKEESTRLIKYFLASLTIPEKDLWVNLSPYEKNRIVPESFGQTEMGRDLLAEDYMLKQITASLIYPEGETGKRFWKRIYVEAAQKFGTTNIPVNTFNKVWIVPEKAVVYENAKAGTAYVVEAKLKVMLEQDYLSMQKHSVIHSFGSQIIREIVIPELTKEVNEGKNFAQLRQVYNSLILATWYKKKIKDSILEQVYVDKNKVAGVNIDDPQEKQRIYERYLQAFKKGAYNYIKEDTDPITQQPIPKKYFSGGAELIHIDPVFRDLKFLSHDYPEALNGYDKAQITVDVKPSNVAGNDSAMLGSIASEARKNILEIIKDKEKGHIGADLSALDILIGIYFGGGFYYDPDPSTPEYKMRDRFVLSKAHAGLALYAVLAKAGFFPMDELKRGYSETGHRFPVMPTTGVTPGVDITVDHLGNGLGKGVGLAIAAKKQNREGKVVVMIGDGESAEGSIYEAGNVAGDLKLDNLIVIVDNNSLGLEQAISAPAQKNMRQLWKALGFNVIEVDGHNSLKIADTLKRLQNGQTKPTLIIANTIKGNTISELTNNPGAHYYRPDQHETIVEREIRLANENPVDNVAMDRWIKEFHRDIHSKLMNRKSQEDEVVKLNEPPAAPISAEFSYTPQSMIGVTKDWLVEAGRSNNKLVTLAADVTPSVGMDAFAKEFGAVGPDNFSGRHLVLPMVERGTMHMAEGLAREGYLPVIGMYEPFIATVLADIESMLRNHLPFVFITTHAGLSSLDGRGYQGIYASGFVNSLPNITMVEPSTPAEARILLTDILRRYGEGEKRAYYVRVSRYPVPDVVGVSKDEILKGFYEVGTSSNPQAVIISMGAISHEAIKAKELLKERGFEAKVIVINNLNKVEEREREFLDLIPRQIPIFTIYDGAQNFLVGMIQDHIRRSTESRNSLYGYITALGELNEFGDTGLNWESLIKRFRLDAESVVETVIGKISTGGSDAARTGMGETADGAMTQQEPNLSFARWQQVQEKLQQARGYINAAYTQRGRTNGPEDNFAKARKLLLELQAELPESDVVLRSDLNHVIKDYWETMFNIAAGYITSVNPNANRAGRVMLGYLSENESKLGEDLADRLLRLKRNYWESELGRADILLNAIKFDHPIAGWYSDGGFSRVKEILDELTKHAKEMDDRLKDYLDQTKKKYQQFEMRYKQNFEERMRQQPGRETQSSISIEDAYKILNIKPGASKKQIRDAFWELVKKLHPDATANIKHPKEKRDALENKLKKVTVAYATLVKNNAMVALLNESNGGIDLTSDKALSVQNNGQGIKFHLDPAQLAQLQNAPGFVPVIINIQPLESLPAFLGISEKTGNYDEVG